MIRQVCPHCFQTVELPDAAAGTTASCPKCHEPIPVPAAYAPTVDPAAGPSTGSSTVIPLERDRPSPPPGFVPPAAAKPDPMADTIVPPKGYVKTSSLVLTPQGLAWIPVACFTLIFLLTFFNWVGTYPGGVRIYSQSPWQALVGDFSVNSLPEPVLRDEADIRDRIHFNFWMWPYILLLLVTLVLAWAERLIRDPAAPGMPPALAKLRDVWSSRFTVLTGLAALLLLLLFIQSWRGFGLESAIRRKVDDQFAPQEREAEAGSTAAKQVVAIEKGREFNRYGLQSTTARQLAVAAHLVALAALAGRWWLDRRGPKPPPRFATYW